MGIKQMLMLAAILMSGRVIAEPIDLDPYIPPTVLTEVVRTQAEKAQAHDQQQANSGTVYEQRVVLKKRGETREEPVPFARQGKQKQN